MVKSSLSSAIRGNGSQRTEGCVPSLAGRVEGRQRLKGAGTNANFKIPLTILPDHLHKLCLIPFDSSRRDLSNGVSCQDRREVATLGNCL